MTFSLCRRTKVMEDNMQLRLMGTILASNDGDKDKELAAQNSRVRYEVKEVGNEVAVAGQGLCSSGEHEPEFNDAPVNMDVGFRRVDVRDIPQQSQGAMIHWERFLPVRSLKVLLVENDDSTRHIVSALLRNCCYEVTPVENGLEAWKILEDLSNHIDIVLTEAVMPILSGIGLLCKIMSHRTLKNIPVIMMSSHDSMGLVFKCLSKGAVDFLVKPLRKNELKILWQHVWRRCHSSSASGSESGTQMKRSVRSKSTGESENNACSSDEHDDESNGVANRVGSDSGSGAQSSWTKRVAEFDSPQPRSPVNQFGDAPDSTCAQVIHTKPETFTSGWVCVSETKGQEQDEQNANFAQGTELEMRLYRNPDSQCDNQPEKLYTHTTKKRCDKNTEEDVKPDGEGQSEHNSENISGGLRSKAPENISRIAGCVNAQGENSDIDTTNGFSAIFRVKDKARCDLGELPSLELTLKRLREAVDGGISGPDDRNVLRHSDLSAFSKYSTASSGNQAPTGNVGSCSPIRNTSTATKKVIHNPPSYSCGIPNQESNGCSRNNDMASANNVTTKPECSNEKLETNSAFRSFHSFSFQPRDSCLSSLQSVKPGGKEDAVANTAQTQLRGSLQQIQFQCHHQHHHHYHLHLHGVQQHQLQLDHEDISVKRITAINLQCGTSNAISRAIDGNGGNSSMNGSVSGSNQGSNGQNGGSAALTPGVANKEDDVGVAGSSFAHGTSGRSIASGTDEDRISHREAALTKFRQKRKERCFEKRVRYQSRKRLAEQRPRIRGQFVRQIVSDARAGKDDSQSNELISDDTSCDSAR